MTVEQENAINLIQKLIDYNSINGEQATTLMLGVMSNNFNIPVSEQPTIEEVKRNYITHEIAEPLPSYTISTTTGVNEMINKITDKT